MFFNNSCYTRTKLERATCYICNYEYECFLNKRNVVGVGFGYKVKNGFYTNQLCLQVFVDKKHFINYINSEDLIPSVYKGIATDVVETGYFSTCSLTDKIIPAIGGYVIGNEYNILGAGTLGCLVIDGTDLFILSNNHTIASINSAPVGNKIMQPSINYGGDIRRDAIASLSKYIPIKFKTFLKKPTNYTDCAIGKAIDRSLVAPEITFVGIPKGTIEPQLNQFIEKIGFKTELTTGKITSIHVTSPILFNKVGKTDIFKEQILTTSMADVGDSGAVLLDKDNYIVGILMAISDTCTTFNPIDLVLKQLNVKIVTPELWNNMNKN